MTTLKLWAIGAITVALLDVVWLGVIMGRFYRTELAPIARVAADGSLAPLWIAAVPVYGLLALGNVAFVLPRATSVVMAAGWGALSGMIVFGVYDLTNLSTLRGYSLRLTLVDIAWGAVSSSIAAVVVKMAQESW